MRSYYRGDEEQAFELFSQTIEMNANLEFAYTGIGKSLLRKGQYYEAMSYFKRSMDQANYSKAFLLYRKELLREHFSLIMSIGLAVIVGAWICVKIRRSWVRKKVVSID